MFDDLVDKACPQLRLDDPMHQNLRENGIMNRREAKVLVLGGRNEMRFDFCQYHIRQLPRYKGFDSGKKMAY